MSRTTLPIRGRIGEAGVTDGDDGGSAADPANAGALPGEFTGVNPDIMAEQGDDEGTEI
jgi:hypothetical protein